MSGWMDLLAYVVAIYVGYDSLNTVTTYWRLNGRPPYKPGDARRLAPSGISMADMLAFVVLKLVFLGKMIVACAQTTLVWAIPALRRPITDEHVISFILNSLWVLRLEFEPEVEGAAPAQQSEPVVWLKLKDFASPFKVDFFECTLFVEFLPRSRRIREFRFNGIDITSPAERFAIIFHTNGTTGHPMCHSFHNEVYAARGRTAADRRHPDMFLHGQALNEAAHFFTGLCFGCNPEWLRVVLAFNAEQPVPLHNGTSLRKLLPFSRLVRFLLPARAHTFRLLIKHGLSVPNEAWFLCSVVHSLDHYFPGVASEWRFMEHDKLTDCKRYVGNFLAMVFYMPTEVRFIPGLHNLLCKKTHKSPFYKDLYEEFSKLDYEYAQHIALSLAS
jgi:hypothetical protein